MKLDKYMGIDVHQATSVVAVLDADGKVVLETIVATEAAPIIRLIQSLNGPLHVTFEETTQAAWLYDVIRAYVAQVVVCDPRRNKLLGEGSKGDKPDARKLAELLRAGLLRSVYHGHEATRRLKELVRAYETLSIDTMRTMFRIKAIYRGRGIRTPGSGVYQLKQRGQWLQQLTEPGVRQRVEWLYEELDHLRSLRKRGEAGHVNGEPRASGLYVAENHSSTRTDSMRTHRSYTGYAASISHEASVVGLQWGWQ
jgi:transposase